MTLRIIAINPKPGAILNVAKIQARVGSELTKFAVEMVSVMAHYPPQQTTSYRRSGDLGRNWKIRKAPEGLATIEVFNNVRRSGRAYAVYPQGPKQGSSLDKGPGTRQTKVMAGKGWQNITTESNRVWKKYEGRIIVALSVS